MTPKSKTPRKLAQPKVDATPRYPSFTRFDPRNTPATDEFDHEHMGIAAKQ
jgi:hypothetical protein